MITLNEYMNKKDPIDIDLIIIECLNCLENRIDALEDYILNEEDTND